MRHTKSVSMRAERMRFVLVRPFGCDGVPRFLREMSSVGAHVGTLYRNHRVAASHSLRAAWILDIHKNSSTIGFDLITKGKIGGNVWRLCPVEKRGWKAMMPQINEVFVMR